MPRREPLRPIAIMALALVALLVALAPGLAQDAPARLTVGAPERPPFATEGSEGSWQGIAVDLWRMVAEQENLSYEIVRVPRDRALDALEAGRVDVVLALDATAQGERRVDFTAPMHVTTLAIASRREIVLWHVVRNMMNPSFLQVAASLSVLLLSVGALVWLVERRNNAGQFHRRPILGLGDGFWWAGVTLTTIGYGDKTPRSFAGRAIAMIWMLLGLAVSAALTASVVSATNAEGNTGLRFPADLLEMRVGTVRDTPTARYLAAQSIPVEEFASLTEALRAFAEHRVDAVAGGDAAVRTAVAALSDDRIIITGTDRNPQFVAIAVRHPADPAAASEVEALRAAVLSQVTSDGWWRLVARYLPPVSDP